MIEKILQRSPFKELTERNYYGYEKILITGGSGSIGQSLAKRLPNATVTDIDTFDITNEGLVAVLLDYHRPDIIINIAGAKHAPLGEVDIEETVKINTLGVINLLKYKGDARLIQCSTCKSANPETVYGATKLISERLTLNSGGTVARFFNVVETSGNVFEIWKDKEVIEVASHCNRYFISLEEATGLLVACIDLKAGRYLVNSRKLLNMFDIANACYPDRPKKIIPQRRGDRINEVFLASNEKIVQYLASDSIIKVQSSHDK
jgi:UDP-N-acetylglucosamine 4,6-dehydratase